MDIGISHGHGSYLDSGRYIPVDVYEQPVGEPLGISLVLEQRGNRDEFSTWHLHQDFIIALRLNLCARNMALYVSSYRSRKEVAEDASHILWEENPKIEETKQDRWNGRIIDIHEGGTPFGAETAVFHVSRTDVDPEEDVPSFDFPTDDVVSSKSWTKKEKGCKVYIIKGELWRNEWVEPSELSPRIRGDKTPGSVFFIIDETGRKEIADKLINESRWLWFKPDVIMALSHRRGVTLSWYTRDTGSVRCSPDYDIHFGVNRLGLINVYAKDIALLPEWQQRIWSGFNVSPEGKVSEELLASQMRAMPAKTQAPERFVGDAYSRLNTVAMKSLGKPLFREHEQQAELIKSAHRFRAVDQAGLFALAMDLTRLTADCIDTRLLQTVVSPLKGKKWGSLKLLDNVLALVMTPEEAYTTMSPLFGMYELRHADTHLRSSDVKDALNLAGVDFDGNSITQGYQLLHTFVATLYEIANALKGMHPKR